MREAPADREAVLTDLEQRYPSLWRAGQLGQGGRLPVWPAGHGALAAELPGGGWPVGALTELLHADHGVGELRLLRPALQSLAQARRRLVLVGPPHPPNAMGLAGWGLPAEQVFWLRTAVTVARAARQSDVLWAAEQVLRSQAFGGVVVWLRSARPEAVRRLQVLAQASESVVWVSRPSAALQESSPAVLRLALSSLPGNAISVLFHKRRGPVRDTPLVLSFDPMPAVPGVDAGASDVGLAAAPAGVPLIAPPARAPAAAVFEEVSDHAVLDRGASAASSAGRVAAELA